MNAATVIQAVQHTGVLINNNEAVESLRVALTGGLRAETMVPNALDEIIAEEAWIDRMDHNGHRYTFDRKAFEKFITSPEPAGLGTTKDAIRKFLGDSSNSLRVRFEELAESGQGSRPGEIHNPNGINQFGKRRINPNDVRVYPEPENDEQQSDNPDRSRLNEPQAGNSVGYAVRRFERESKKSPAVAAIFDQLKAGEISAHAASVMAGFKPKSINIILEPAKAGRLLAKHFTTQQFDQLILAYREARQEHAS